MCPLCRLYIKWQPYNVSTSLDPERILCCINYFLYTSEISTWQCSILIFHCQILCIFVLPWGGFYFTQLVKCRIYSLCINQLIWLRGLMVYHYAKRIGPAVYQCCWFESYWGKIKLQSENTVLEHQWSHYIILFSGRASGEWCGCFLQRWKEENCITLLSFSRQWHNR